MRAGFPAAYSVCRTAYAHTVATPLEDLVRRHVEAGAMPGAVALLATDEVEVVAVGVASVGGEPMRGDAIVRIQSMTKVIEAVGALRLVEAGRLGLDQSLEEWLPELADRRVLSTPTADLDDTVPARRPITLRHLLTNASGYGAVLVESPLQKAMLDNGVEAGPQSSELGADEWLARLAELPLAFQPGEGWRYHHSFGVLGILIGRVAGRPLNEHLEADLFDPLGMKDTAFWVPEPKLGRLPAAYRHGADGLVETEPAAGGPYAGPPAVDVSHGELVSSASDFHRFLRMLADDGRFDGDQLISPDHVRMLISDQVPAASKTPDSFFPGFWRETGWGFGVGTVVAGPTRGRYGWGGGQGTEFFVDPDGGIAILLTQVELGERMSPVFEDFRALRSVREGDST